MPASNLNQGSGVAAGYGIGAGLSSFADAYMNALNYQLLKSRAASDAQYQQTMEQVALRHASTEEAEIPIHEAEVNAKFAPYGSDVLEYYGRPPAAGPHGAPMGQSSAPPQQQMPPRGLINPLPLDQVGPQPSPQLIQQSQNDQVQLRQSPVNPLGQGLMGPQPSPGMLQNSQAAQAPGQLPAQSQTRVGGPPQFLSQWQREALQKNMAEAAMMTAKAKADGKNMAYVGDIQGVHLTTQGPYTGDAALAQEKAINENQNLKYAQRSTNQEAMNDYNQNPATQAAKRSAVPMNALIKVLKEKNPYPEEIQGAMRNSIAVQFGNDDEKALDAMMTSPAMTDKLNNYLSMAKSGTPVKEIINGIAQSAINSHVANTQGMIVSQKKAMQILGAHGGNANDPGISLDPNAMRAYQDALNIQKTIPQNISPSQRPDSSWLGRISSWIPGGEAVAAKPATQTKPSKGIITPDILNQYAKKHQMSVESAKQYLGSQGYGF